MEISFQNLIMPKATAMGTVSFQVTVDGEFIWCEISAEALRNHFDAISMDEKDLLHAFHNGRAAIEETTQRHLESNGGRSVLLMTGNF